MNGAPGQVTLARIDVTMRSGRDPRRCVRAMPTRLVSEAVMMTLEGVRVLDLSRLAPGPFCTMLLADLGADVLMIEGPAEIVSRGAQPAATAGRRTGNEWRRGYNALRRNKRSMILNLREQEGRDIFYRLCEDFDVIIEGFRPGVVQRLGVDYDTVAKINPKLVYCSLSGYGQTGPYRDMVGHDINYISIGGALGLIGRPGVPPAIPQNILGDFAGGGLMAAFSIVAALLARERTGRGQFVDISMSDGVLYMLASAASGLFGGGDAPRPGETGLSGARPQYDVYECLDGKWISIGSLEPHFWTALCEALGRPDFVPLQNDRAREEEIRDYFRKTFLLRTRDEWFDDLKDLDVCVSPVLGLEEALRNPHHLAREMVVNVVDHRHGTFPQVGVAPKFSDTPAACTDRAAARAGHGPRAGTAGFGWDEVLDMKNRGIVGLP
ncbi:MAG: CoA transferase [Dehalococcoidia bacterium]